MRQVDQPPEQRTDVESTGSELEISHIAGRRNAILASVVVVGVLIAMVWVGMSGRTNPSPAPTFPALADIPTDSPEPSLAATPRQAPGETPAPIANPQLPQDLYGASVQLGDLMSTIVLTEVEPGRLFGRLRLELPPPEVDGTFVFQQFASKDVRGQPIPIADWPINVDAMAADSPQFLAVNATLPARRSIRNAPRPVENGYHLTVTGQRRGSEGELTISVRIGPNRELQGNDGILGWPVVSQLRKPQVDRTRGRFNYCRWDVGAIAARPKPGTDEADCLG